MAKFLFWNLARKPLHGLVAAITKDSSIDVILLAESSTNRVTMLRALSSEMPDSVFEVPRLRLCERIAVYLRYTDSFWTPVAEGPRHIIAQYKPAVKLGLLVAVAHLPSRVNSNRDDIDQECTHFASEIRKWEKRRGTDRTIVVGDLNLDPFDRGVATAMGLHGVMSKEVAERGGRVVNGKKYKFFYNPMWGRLGDESEGPPGSCYYSRSDHTTYFWHTFDQLLLRPSLLPEFKPSSMHFLTTVRGKSLLRNGIPNRTSFSDHLPLIFDIGLKTQTGDYK